ncbi:MAG TPA: serine hydrolase domain-containing protein, partial [Burkholderiaceae bacterium]|nr:serine hydrolase domain-containing protein [Burkholderiaceae bacterium]
MSLKQSADTLLRHAADTGEVPGVVAMATGREATTYEGAFGKRVLGQDAPMTPDTVVWIASMTKALTSTAAMQLVERGKLDLDSPVSRWVPEIGNAQVLEGFEASGQPRTRPPKRAITLRDLLTHTAGFSYEFWSSAIQQYQKAKELPSITTCQNAA